MSISHESSPTKTAFCRKLNSPVTLGVAKRERISSTDDESRKSFDILADAGFVLIATHRRFYPIALFHAGVLDIRLCRDKFTELTAIQVSLVEANEFEQRLMFDGLAESLYG